MKARPGPPSWPGFSRPPTKNTILEPLNGQKMPENGSRMGYMPWKAWIAAEIPVVTLIVTMGWSAHTTLKSELASEVATARESRAEMRREYREDMGELQRRIDGRLMNIESKIDAAYQAWLRSGARPDKVQ